MYLTKEALDELPEEAVIEVSWRQLAPAQIHSAGAVREIWPTYSTDQTRLWLFERCAKDIVMNKPTFVTGDEVCEICNGTYQGHPFCVVMADYIVLCDGKHAVLDGLMEAAHAQR